jgi:signal transduction histidine kinase/ActR/RegA family two-component response regulator
LTETYLKPLGITSILDSGIIIEGYLRGVVCSEHLGPIRQWHPDEEAFLSTVAAMVAQFLVNVERKQAEEEREILQAQLIQAQKMESVGRLAGGVAHDFNNMLGVILGYTGLVLEQTNPSDPLSKYLQQIHKAAERSADLTRQLLAFARKQTVAPQVLDLNNTVEGMLRLLRRLIGEDIDLAWLPGRELWPVKMDHSQLDQILANLCVNARDAIAGVGKVTIETANTVFDAEYCARHAGFVPGDYVLLAVSDNGCGMDAETLSRIFEPFFTTKEVGQGTGLGLASVYGAVTQNNGLINTYSEPGQGTTFKIYLPRHTDIVVQATAEPQQAAARGSETVLLVEDEPMMLELTMSMLEQLGYTVLAARTPGEAMRLAREHSGSIDLLITDVVMPEMNGRDLAGNLLALYPGMKCLFMSGYTANVIAHHGVLEEGVHFLEKPFLMTDLAANIRKALGQ